MNGFKCIYAILDSGEKSDLGLEGLNGSSVYTIAYKDISAAVSDVEKGFMKVSEGKALAYEKIVEDIMIRYDLLPMRFGTLVKNDGEVIGLLQKYYDGFVANLARVKRKLEYGLKILWTAEKHILEKSAINEGEDSNVFDQLRGNSPSRKYLTEKFKEYRSEKALLKEAERIIEDIHKPLQELSSLSKSRKVSSEKIFFDATYLVEKEKKDAFVERFKKLNGMHRDVKCLLTGPWPPYNFIEQLSEVRDL